MLTAKEAREKQLLAIKSNRIPFDEALAQIENEIITCAAGRQSRVIMALDIDRATAKQLKKELKKAGYRGIAFDEFSFGYIVNCSW